MNAAPPSYANVIDDKLEQFSNKLKAKILLYSYTTVAKLEQSLNANEPIDSTVSVNVTAPSLVHPSNAPFPIVCTLFKSI